jgi:hypothetical protein
MEIFGQIKGVTARIRGKDHLGFREILIYVIRFLFPKTIAENIINFLFKKIVWLSTIHKAKGLESRRVFFLNSH